MRFQGFSVDPRSDLKLLVLNRHKTRRDLMETLETPEEEDRIQASSADCNDQRDQYTSAPEIRLPGQTPGRMLRMSLFADRRDS
jgi:hypothetical protein